MRIFTFVLISLLSFNLYAEDISIKVSGMVCSLCAQGIKKKFSKLEGVKDIQVDLDSKLVLVKMKEKQDLSDSQIKEIITEAGYNVSNIERK